MAPPNEQKSVFLIYAHADRETVRRLYRRLLRDGIHVWRDAEKLQPGQHWQAEIRKALLKSEIVIICLSEKFNEQNGYRHEELKLALEKARLIPNDEIFIIPVKLEKCEMPASLKHLHRVNLFEADGYKKLLQALRA